MDQMTIGGLGVYDEYGMRLLRAIEVKPPAPKFNFVDIPGGDSSIDLTDASAGGVTFSDREDVFYFDVEGDVSRLVTRISNAIHGRRLEYTVPGDPEYTYFGRFDIEDRIYMRDGRCRLKVTVRGDPYKLKETRTYRVNAAGGIVVTLESGRMPVCPVFEFASETIVSMGGVRARMQPGSYKINDLWLSEGRNEVYINSYLGDGNVTVERYLQDTVAAHRDQRASDLMWEGVRGAAVSVAEWADDTVEAHKAERVLEAEFSVDASSEKFSVYVQYDWKDL